MKKIKAFSLGAAVSLLTIWVMGAFIALEPNPLAWTGSGRVAAVVFAVIAMPSAGLFAMEESR